MKRLLINPICERATHIVDPLSHLQRRPAIFEAKNHPATIRFLIGHQENFTLASEQVVKASQGIQIDCSLTKCPRSVHCFKSICPQPPCSNPIPRSLSRRDILSSRSFARDADWRVQFYPTALCNLIRHLIEVSNHSYWCQSKDAFTAGPISEQGAGSRKRGLKVLELNWNCATTVWRSKMHAEEMMQISAKNRSKSPVKKQEQCRQDL